MKKLLLLMMALFWSVTAVTAQDTSAPEFPKKFKVSADSEAVTITQGFDEDYDAPIINATGTTTEDTVKLTFYLPEGWDGLIGAYVSVGTMKKSRADWRTIDELKAEMEGADIMQGKVLEFPADGSQCIGQFFLYAGDQVDEDHPIMIAVNVGKEAVEPDPEFPTEFKVSADSEAVTITQGFDEDYDAPMIIATGTTTEDTVKLTFDLPEGWDGLIGAYVSVEVMKKSRADWPTIDDFKAEMEGADIMQGKVLEFPADGSQCIGQFCLYAGDQVDVDHPIMIVVNVGKEVTEPDPVVPDSYEVTLSAEGLEVNQAEDYGCHTITIEGEIETDELTVTLTVPEGWDGFLCITEDELKAGIAPFAKASPVEWQPIDGLISFGFRKGNSLVFPIAEDSEEQGGQFYLYKGENVDIANQIYVEVNVTKKIAVEPDPVVPDTFEVTLSAEGLTVTQSEDSGSHTIAISGECEADELTVTVVVPEGWDGFVGMTENDFIPDVEPLAKAAAIEWVPVADLIEFGMKEGNSLTFPITEEVREQEGQLYLYKGENADSANQIIIEVNVSKPQSGLTTVTVVDENARYYDLNGREVNTPKAGIYVKIADGKASKVIVK